MVSEAVVEDPSLSLNAAVKRIGSRVGVVSDTLRGWVKQADIDGGRRPGTTSSEAAAVKDLQAQVRELKRANAHRRDGDVKADREHTAIGRLQRSGQQLTFTGVAREARVSTWFLYNRTELAAAVRAAIEDQQDNGDAATEHPATRVSSASLATDLALARTEIKDLRQQRDQLRTKVQLALGAELDAVGTHELLERIRELEHENATLRNDVATHSARATDATHRVDHLEADLAGARLSLRRMVRDANTPGGSGSTA